MICTPSSKPAISEGQEGGQLCARYAKRMDGVVDFRVTLLVSRVDEIEAGSDAGGIRQARQTRGLRRHLPGASRNRKPGLGRGDPAPCGRQHRRGAKLRLSQLFLGTL